MVPDGEEVITPPGSTKKPGQGDKLVNDTHDESLAVDGEEIMTPSKGKAAASAAQKLANDTHDEMLSVGGDDTHEVRTPDMRSKGAGAGKTYDIRNESHDAAVVVDGDEQVPTPTGSDDDDDAGKKIQNDTHDMAVELSGERHVSTPPDTVGKRAGAGGRDSAELRNQPHDMAVDAGGSSSISSDGGDESPDKSAPPSTTKVPPPLGGAGPSGANQMAPIGGGTADADQDSSDDDDEARGGGDDLYNPAEYENLPVSKETKELFQFILFYKPHDIEVEPKLHPFIPDYIPAIGDIDGFIKVPRPDDKSDSLGLVILDEPGANQSNTSVVSLGLAYQTRSRVTEQHVESVEEGHKKPKVIEKWVKDVKTLHTNKPSPQVNYTKQMPDLETLLQVWPADFEELLSRVDLTLPPAAIDLDVAQYTRVVCTLLDIPTYTNLVESLHVLLSLYAEFKANQHFQGGAFSQLTMST
eukprot:Hpha_TRINITY_DN14980_c0_g1::TRINITY_DN14980_c0_g1_i1::g.142857::m.142857/K19682/IFT46; intraflagellar transport protein 46